MFSIFKKQQRKFADKHIKEEKSKPKRTRKILISQITTVFYMSAKIWGSEGSK
jgi:hypothetical protein